MKLIRPIQIIEYLHIENIVEPASHTCIAIVSMLSMIWSCALLHHWWYGLLYYGLGILGTYLLTGMFIHIERDKYRLSLMYLVVMWPGFFLSIIFANLGIVAYLTGPFIVWLHKHLFNFHKSMHIGRLVAKKPKLLQDKPMPIDMVSAYRNMSSAECETCHRPITDTIHSK